MTEAAVFEKFKGVSVFNRPEEWAAVKAHIDRLPPGPERDAKELEYALSNHDLVAPRKKPELVLVEASNQEALVEAAAPAQETVVEMLETESQLPFTPVSAPAQTEEVVRKPRKSSRKTSNRQRNSRR